MISMQRPNEDDSLADAVWPNRPRTDEEWREYITQCPRVEVDAPPTDKTLDEVWGEVQQTIAEHNERNRKAADQ